ncbi:hypothetical protein ACSBR2_012527 [Camellia fascicularis]
MGCKNSSNNNDRVAPYLIKINLEVLEISFNGSYLRVNNPVTSPNYPISNNVNSTSSIDLRFSPFRFA